MSTDVIEQPTEVTEETAPVEAEAATTEETPKREKKVVEPHACLCASFFLADRESNDEVDTTECDAKTLRVFGQGHDARLVSFLVKGHFDGYALRQHTAEGTVEYTDPAHAVSGISDALVTKAENATKNAQTRLDDKTKRAEARAAKQAETKAAREKAAAEKADARIRAAAEKAASKTTGPKAVAAKVVEGSQTGDAKGGRQDHVPTDNEDGTKNVLIKVGRGTYDAILSADGSTVNYRDNEGVEQTRETDTVRMLSKLA